MSFAAKYYGICPRCERSIVPGQLCTYDDDDSIVHVLQADCDAYAARMARRAENPDICPKCHMAHPCEHDE